jgi:hypothetical protein
MNVPWSMEKIKHEEKFQTPENINKGKNYEKQTVPGNAPSINGGFGFEDFVSLLFYQIEKPYS